MHTTFPTPPLPRIIETSCTTTETREEKRAESDAKEENRKDRGKQQFHIKSQVPVRASTSWENPKGGPSTTLERKRVPTKRYCIDVMKSENEDKETEVIHR